MGKLTHAACGMQPHARQVLALEMLILMLERPSADSVEMAAEFIKEVGAYLQDVAPQGLHRCACGWGFHLHPGGAGTRGLGMECWGWMVRRCAIGCWGLMGLRPEAGREQVARKADGMLVPTGACHVLEPTPHVSRFAYTRSVFERFRAVLHEGEIEKRVQFVVEGLFAVRKAGFEKSGFPAVKPELDLVDAGGW